MTIFFFFIFIAFSLGITYVAARRTRSAAHFYTAGGGITDLMNPAQVAQMLGVGESDVLASLEAGDLKGKKIGTQWRVTRESVTAFLKS